MQLKAREDIEAPIDDVFRAVTDFDRFERVLLRRGAEIVRVDDLAAAGPGMRWAIDFDMRGKRRRADLEVTEFVAPERLCAIGRGPGVTVHMEAQLIALSRHRTRLETRTRLEPGSFSGKMLLQSLRLARGKIMKRYRRAVADFATRIEDRASSQGRGRG
ncbi:MAG TPA: SRPBCC family protein [Aliiroseovarius sp.]|nr:SRPBCC family protein [Aliiroseovarius sp.]